MASVISKNYYKRVVGGAIKNVNKIPLPWRKEVIKMLEEDGYTINEDGTVTKNKEEK